MREAEKLIRQLIKKKKEASRIQTYCTGHIYWKDKKKLIIIHRKSEPCPVHTKKAIYIGTRETKQRNAIQLIESGFTKARIEREIKEITEEIRKLIEEIVKMTPDEGIPF